MPEYSDQRFDPPAPMAAVELRAEGRAVSGVEMLIDSGSDVTLLPASALSRLGIEADRQRPYDLMAFDGSKTVAMPVRCEVIFLGRAFRGRYLVLESAYGILGRDILNHLSLILDGPRLEWREELASQ
jgi:hypothetical protein